MKKIFNVTVAVCVILVAHLRSNGCDANSMVYSIWLLNVF